MASSFSPYWLTRAALGGLCCFLSLSLTFLTRPVYSNKLEQNMGCTKLGKQLVQGDPWLLCAVHSINQPQKHLIEVVAQVEKPQSQQPALKCEVAFRRTPLFRGKNLKLYSLMCKVKCCEKALTICVGVSHFFVCHYSCCCIIYLNEIQFTVLDNKSRK